MRIRTFTYTFENKVYVRSWVIKAAMVFSGIVAITVIWSLVSPV